jgi:hypothetical protein
MAAKILIFINALDPYDFARAWPAAAMIRRPS